MDGVFGCDGNAADWDGKVGGVFVCSAGRVFGCALPHLLDNLTLCLYNGWVLGWRNR